jgi:hypothetical protein
LNSYKLNDKDEDQNFLAGNPVKGTAVFLTNEFKNDIVVNEKIVVVLSNGKKYMGKVMKFTYTPKGKVIEGYLEVVKS